MHLKVNKLIGDVECVGFPLRFPGGWIALDTEATGLDPYGELGVDRDTAPARPYGFSFCNADGETAFVRWQVNAITREVVIDRRTFKIIQKILANRDIEKRFFNAPYDIRMLKMSGFKIRGKCYDYLIGIKVIKSDEMNLQLKRLCKKYLAIDDADEKLLTKSVNSEHARIRSMAKRFPKSIYAKFALSHPKADMFYADRKLFKKYSIQDALRTATLSLAVNDELDQDRDRGGKMWTIFYREHDLAKVVAAMENRGVRVDMKRIKELIKFYRTIRDAAKAGIDSSGGEGLNPDSPPQMQKEFFGKRGHKPLKYCKANKNDDEFTACPHCAIKPPKKPKGFVGKWSSKRIKSEDGCEICQFTGDSPKCDGEFLEHIGIRKKKDKDGKTILKPADKLAWHLLHYSAACQMLAFVEQYKELAEWDDVNKCWVLHPNYRQIKAKTARFTCETPNLQNVAADDSGKKRVDIPYRPRECFLPRKGFVFYNPDYSQIEIWVLALLSGDEDFINALTEGSDAHEQVAKAIWGDRADYEKNKSKYRKLAKNLQFCMIYGGGDEKVATMIGDGCTVEQARQFKEEYNKRLPLVKRFMKSQIEAAKRNSCVVNPYGRTYAVHPMFAYRSTNYLIQGTAAEVIKNAMVRVYKKLCKAPEYKGKLFILLTIHDELMIEVHKSIDTSQLIKKVVKAMQEDYKFLGCPVPFPIGFKRVDDRWSNSTTVNLKELEAA